MLLKASRITNLTDARYFAAKEVDFLGFNLEEGTAGYLDPMYMKAIREWVEGPQVVGEFSVSPLAVVREAAAFFGLDAVQVSARTHAGMLDELAGLTVFLEIDIDVEPEQWPEICRQAAPQVSFFVIAVDAGTLTSVDSSLKELCALYPVLIRLNEPSDSIETILSSFKPAGLDFIGGEEEQVGVKSFDELEEIFEMLGR